jgi:NAD-dependent oxidoreductase involved in siderophore biosynthesis
LYTFFKFSLCENFEPRFIKKTLKTLVSQGPKRSRDLAKKKGKEKFATLEIVVGIGRPHDDFQKTLDIL